MTKIKIKKTELIQDDKHTFEKLFKQHDIKGDVTEDNHEYIVYTVDTDEATAEDILVYSRLPWDFA